MRLPLVDTMAQTQIVILKTGWNPYPHAGDIRTGVAYVSISNTGTVNVNVQIAGFSPMLRFYLRRFER